jgi:hypothetical protein
MNNMRFSITGFANILTVQFVDVNFAEVIAIQYLIAKKFWRQIIIIIIAFENP